MCNKIAIVDLNDNIIGFEDKIKVHKEGILHRAFSVFIFNERNELLLQKRAKTFLLPEMFRERAFSKRY